MIGLIVVTCVFGVVQSFPDGAPSIACGAMKPLHLPSSTSGPNPFKLNISATSYKPGDIIKGTLTGSGDNLKFKGFLLEVGTASSVDERETAVGEFIDIDSSVMKHVCGQGGITHINNQEKTQVSFTWQAPSTSAGDLSIRATVVQVYNLGDSRYWLGAFSERIKAE